MSDQQMPGGSQVPPSGGGQPGQHLPWVAALLSLLFPGIGRIYNRQTTKGAVILVVDIGGWFVTYLLSYICIGVLLIPLMVAITVVAVVDAALIGQKVAEGRTVQEWEFF